MLEELKTLLGLTSDDEPILKILIDLCKTYIVDYCNLKMYDKEFDYLVKQMVCEKWTQLGSEGLASRSFSGVSESFLSNFSESILMSLKKHRRIGVI